jgi:PAS domain S-box-containing protein
MALLSSRAETQEGRTDLRESTLALASSLRKSDEQVHQLFEAAPIAIVMISPAGQIKMVNTRTEKLFGFTRSELLGAPVELLMPAGSRDWFQGLETGVATGRTPDSMGKDCNLFGLKKDGSQVELEIGLSLVETAGETMLLSAIVDISNRVRLEAQLHQAQKMEAIGRMAAGIAHDFNNLLLALGGSLELLLDAVADQPEVKELGRIALRAAARGKELTNRLLSFSRKEVLTARPVKIEDLFNELHGMINHLFDPRTTCGIELVTMPCAPDLAVLADFARLEDALINLAMNARDAMPDGGRLRISACESDADPAIVPPGKYTVLSVADTGTGMDAQTLARACEPFFSTKRAHGTGLGLSMVHGFARQSGGDMQIFSAVGKGTTIDLWLPSVRAPAESAQKMSVQKMSGQTIAPSVKMVDHMPEVDDSTVVALAHIVGRVLVVDDSSETRYLISEFLRRAGMDVTSTATGELALAELVDGKRFDVLVSDFTMPGMNGLELFRRAREIDPLMIVLLITAVVEPELQSGINDIVVLRKPFKRMELIDTLRELMAANRDVAAA